MLNGATGRVDFFLGDPAPGRIRQRLFQTNAGRQNLSKVGDE
jgi:hypothetical protein